MQEKAETSASAFPPKERRRYNPPPFAHLSFDLVATEADRFGRAHERMNRLWEEESVKYEETISIPDVNGKDVAVPRRNYLNQAIVPLDQSLFPYHSSCYPLLDAYDCLYVDEDGDVDETLMTDSQPSGISLNTGQWMSSVLPYQRQPWRHERGRIVRQNVQGFMPCSTSAILTSLFPLLYTEETIHDGPSYWTVIRGVISHHNLGNAEAFFTRMNADDDESTEVDQSRRPLGSNLPHDREERAAILLKLLRHSLSDLQKDYKLAAAATVALLVFRDLEESLDVFRQFLAVVGSEFVCCYKPCDHDMDESVDHDCSEWQAFFSDVFTDVFCLGFESITTDHALCLVGLVRFFFYRKFGLFAESSPDKSAMEKRKDLLKRTAAQRIEDDDDSDEVRGRDVAGNIPVQFIELLATVLGMRGSLDRNHVLSCNAKMQAADNSLVPFMECVEDSYDNCIRALVGMSELSILWLPEHDRFGNIASALVWSLYRCLVRDDHFAQIYDDTYMGLTKDSLRSMRLSSPLRFANRVTGATAAIQALRSKREQIMDETLSDVASFKLKFEYRFDCPPPKEIVSVVRGLFLKNLMNLCYLGMGYGDFLVWCRCEVSPLDPLLFWNEYAFPEDEEDQDDSEDEDGSVSHLNRSAHWDCDDDEHTLTNGEINAHYDFSLLLLQRAWQAPWCPDTHASFQPGFREAVSTVAHCARRVGFPNETMMAICSFLSRDWWEDSRRQCWSFECQGERSTKAIERQTQGLKPAHATIQTLEYCPDCRVAAYCSKECRKKDCKTGHKKRCNRPPLVSQAPGSDELMLCFDTLPHLQQNQLPNFLTSRSNAPVLVQESTAITDTDGAEESSLGDANDDDSWETLSSGDADANGSQSKTTKIYQFFKEKTYSVSS